MFITDYKRTMVQKMRLIGWIISAFFTKFEESEFAYLHSNRIEDHGLCSYMCITPVSCVYVCDLQQKKTFLAARRRERILQA